MMKIHTKSPTDIRTTQMIANLRFSYKYVRFTVGVATCQPFGTGQKRTSAWSFDWRNGKRRIRRGKFKNSCTPINKTNTVTCNCFIVDLKFIKLCFHHSLQFYMLFLSFLHICLFNTFIFTTYLLDTYLNYLAVTTKNIHS